jgi:DNA-binding response OmpR family regulator
MEGCHIASAPKRADNVLVLLVEDDILIQISLEKALNNAGFAVITACSGDEAIAALNANDLHFCVLVSDIQLGPGATGWDVSRRARELDETLPVVYISGGNAHEWKSEGVPNSMLIGKPFRLAQIVTAVSQAMNIPTA